MEKKMIYAQPVIDVYEMKLQGALLTESQEELAPQFDDAPGDFPIDIPE